MAAAESTKAKGGIGGMLILAVVIMLASGSGAAFTLLVPAMLKGEDEGKRETAPAKSAAAEAPGEAAKSDAPKEHVLPLEPLIVSAVGTGRIWLRLEGAVSFSVLPGKDEQTALLRQMSEDVMLFLRSTSSSQFETPAGLEFLREDLSELVRLRSKGRARRFILKMLVLE